MEVLQDVIFRIAPTAPLDAQDMTHGVRGAKLLEGVRGEPRADFEAIEEVLERVSQLAAIFPRSRELDINPLLVYGDQVVAVDGRAMVG